MATAEAAAEKSATAPAAENVSASIRQSFTDLAHSDPGVREQALVNLMGMPRQDLPRLQRLVEQSRPLRPSQAAVLRQIVTQVYLAGEPYESNGHFGFLGVRMAESSVNQLNTHRPNQEEPSTGIVITECLAGFSGSRFLRTGDVILGIVERPDVKLQGAVEFGTAIRELGPGRQVRFEVLRDGQVVKINVTLDPRPVEADIDIAALDYRRRNKAEEYWQRSFAPLLKETTS